MFVRSFRVERAGCLADASALLRRHNGNATVIAGGQSLLPLINLGLARPRVVVDILPAARQDPQLRAIGVTDGYLTAGALVTHARLAADPVAAGAQPLPGVAASFIGTVQVRNRGTLGGSLADSDPAAELPLVMVALGADYDISNGTGTRSVRAEEFHLDDRTTPLQPDDLIVAVRMPTLGPGWGWGFQRSARRYGDPARISVAVLLRTAGGLIVESRVAVAGMGERPMRLADIEIALGGATVADATGRVGVIRDGVPAGAVGAGSGYRAHLARVLVTRAIDDACRRSAVGAADERREP